MIAAIACSIVSVVTLLLSLAHRLLSLFFKDFFKVSKTIFFVFVQVNSMFLVHSFVNSFIRWLCLGRYYKFFVYSIKRIPIPFCFLVWKFLLFSWLVLYWVVLHSLTFDILYMIPYRSLVHIFPCLWFCGLRLTSSSSPLFVVL